MKVKAGKCYILSYIFLMLFLNTSSAQVLDDSLSVFPTDTGSSINYREILSKNRIALQSIFIADQKNIEIVYSQTAELEKAIVDFVEFSLLNSSKDTLAYNFGADPELYLARLIYVRAKTWCMEESLKKRTGEIYSVNLDKLPEDHKYAIATAGITENVLKNLESAKRYDRLNYRNDNELVVKNWQHTVKILKKFDHNVISRDSEFHSRYKNMLSDLDSMIAVLNRF